MSKPRVSLAQSPILLTIAGRSRQVKFNFLSVAALQDAGFLGMEFAEALDADEKGQRIKINYRNLLAYLWASLQSDFAKHGDALTMEELADEIPSDGVQPILEAVGNAVAQYYSSEGKAKAESVSAAPPAAGE